MARHHTPIGGFNELWERHEHLYHDIFMNALNMLEITDKQREHEDAISEALCPVLQSVCFAHPEKPLPPQWERPITPVTANELKGGKIRKRPDFMCSLVNSFANSPEMYEVSLHIECKRLGEKSGSWDLNKNYAENGIKRFDSSTHEYGKRAPSGIMIGYIINSNRSVILSTVNKHIKLLLTHGLVFDFIAKITFCETIFSRKVTKPKKFKLIHLWADLRNVE